MLRPFKMPKDNSKEVPAGGFGAGLIERVDALKRPRNSVSKVANLHFRNFPALSTRHPHTRFAETSGPATGLHPFYESDVASVTKIADLAAGIRVAAWSADSRLLAVARANSGRVDIYRREGMSLTLDEPAGYNFGTNFWVEDMEWSPDGNLLAVALRHTPGTTTTCGRVLQWDGGKLVLLTAVSLGGSSARIRSVSWSGDGDHVAVADYFNGRIYVHRRNRQNPNASWSSLYNLSVTAVWDTALSPDGTLLAASREGSQVVAVWRTADRSTMTVSGTVTGHMADLSWSADGQYLAAASRFRTTGQPGDFFLWQYNANDDRLDPVSLPDLNIRQQAYATEFANESGFVAVVVDTKPNRVLDDWQEGTVPTGFPSMDAIAFGNNLFVAVGQERQIWSAGTNLAWTQRLANAEALFDVIYSGALFVAVGSNGALYSSNNGTSWTSRASGTPNDLHGVSFGGGLFVAVGAEGTVVTSASGTTGWTAQDSGVTEDLYAVAYGMGKHVIVGQGGVVLVSDDGVTWEPQTSGTDSDLYAVIANGDRFIAAGAGGVILVSEDGETWHEAQSGTNATVRRIAVGETFLIAVCDDSSILVSEDGEVWEVVASSATPLRGICFGGNAQFVAVGGADDVGVVYHTAIKDDPQPGRGLLLRVDGSLVSVVSTHIIDWPAPMIAWSGDEDLLLVPGESTGQPMHMYFFDKQRRESLIVGSGPDVYSVTADGQVQKIGTGLAPDRPWSAASISGRVVMTDGVNPVKAWNGLEFVDLPGDPPKQPVIMSAYNRLFLAGENIIYVSDIDNIEAWTGGDAGSIPVGAGTGDAIQHMASDGPIAIWMRSRLYQLRGPDEGQLLNEGNWRLNEVAPVGTVNSRTVVRSSLGWFWLSQVGIHFWGGGVSVGLISEKIEDVIHRINWPYIDTACAWLDRTERYHLSVPLDNATEPSHVVVFDPRSQTFTLYRDLPPYSFAATFSSPAFRDIGYEVPVMLASGGGLYTEADSRRFQSTDETVTKLAWELEWGPSSLGLVAHDGILRRVYVVLSMEPGSTANLQTSVDEGRTWTDPERLQADAYMTKVRRNLPLNTGEVNRGASFMVRIFGTGVVTVHDIVPVGEGLAS